MLKSLFTCNHARTPVAEGKCFCPDCGQGIIYQWVVLRCPGCSHRRNTRYRLRGVAPAEACCLRCGERAVVREVLESPFYFQLSKARLVALAEEEYLLARWAIRSRAWLDMGRLLPQLT